MALGPLFLLLFLLFLLRRSANNQFLLDSAFLPVYTVFCGYVCSLTSCLSQSVSSQSVSSQSVSSQSVSSQSVSSQSVSSQSVSSQSVSSQSVSSQDKSTCKRFFASPQNIAPPGIVCSCWLQRFTNGVSLQLRCAHMCSWAQNVFRYVHSKPQFLFLIVSLRRHNGCASTEKNS